MTFRYTMGMPKNAVNVICYTYDSYLAALQEIYVGSNQVKAVQANGLLLQIKNFKFLVLLIMFDRLLSNTKSLSDYLQSTQVNLAKACDLVSGTVSTLHMFGTDQEWDKVYSYAEKVAEINSIETRPQVSRPQVSRHRHLPRHLQNDFGTATTVGTRAVPTTSVELTINLYFPVLDAFLAELNRCFSNKNIELMHSVSSL